MKKKKFLIIFIVILFFPFLNVKAGFFPNDAKTIYYELEGVGQANLLPAGDKTILGGSIQQSGVASLSYIRCNGNVLFKNYAKDLGFQPVNFLCPYIVSVDKTGQDNASFKITYVNYNLASSSSDILNTQPAIINYATPTPMIFSNNIENIGYIATTTLTSAGINITQGTYFIPFILFKFILAILTMTIFAIVLLLFFKRNN